VASAPADRGPCHAVFHAVGAKLLVEIGPEGGRRHNSPLKNLPSSEGDTTEGPLGDGRNALLLLLPSLSRLQLPPNYFYFYYYYNYFLIL
jgi:hypothetical protein